MNFERSLLYTIAYKRQRASHSLLLERKASRDFVSLPKKTSDEDICDYHPLDMYSRNEKDYIRLHYHILGGVIVKERSLIAMNVETY